ncbi:MAG: hypothetical protein ACI906_001650 [Candidatus Latescibacterota bacterium]|jgi:hypothetical protein
MLHPQKNYFTKTQFLYNEDLLALQIHLLHFPILLILLFKSVLIYKGILTYMEIILLDIGDHDETYR